MATSTTYPAMGFVKSHYNYNVDTVSEATGLACPEESRAQQHFKEESDINVLVRRFNLTGELPKGVRVPTYEDFSESYDFHTAANLLAEANEAFMRMPARVRMDRFNNDPAAFVAFVSNDENRSEAEKLGIVPPPPKAENPAPNGAESTVLP